MSKERTVTGRDDSPAIQVCNELERAGFGVGDKVSVTAGDGYVLVTSADADVPISEVPVSDRPNVSDCPIESSLEARIVGNRLFKMGEKYADEHLTAETQELARRFHKYAEELKDA